MRIRSIASSVVAAIASMVAAVAGARWWIIAGICGCIALYLIVQGVQTVFPQESADRLEWWLDRRRHQRLIARTSTVGTPTAQGCRSDGCPNAQTQEDHTPPDS